MRYVPEGAIESTAGRRARVTALMLTVSLLVSACGLPERTLVGPEPAETTDVVVRVMGISDNEETILLSALGWQSGLPDAVLSLSTLDGDSTVAEVTTGADGQVTLPDLPLGQYRARVSRALSAAERASLGATGDAEGFLGSAVVTVSAVQSSEVRVEVPASFRRGLVISEYALSSAYTPGLGYYFPSGFIELYNNGDTTVYLDGMLMAEGSPVNSATPEWCSFWEQWNASPEGIWTSYLVAFPGTGRQYPVPPGTTVLIAEAAIDHRALYPGMLDLRHADFEIPGGPDNPQVPNMINWSTISSPIDDQAILGHAVLSGRLTLAAAEDPRSYRRTKRQPTDNHETVLVPAGAILDVISVLSTWTLSNNSRTALCPRRIHPRFDREEGFLLGDNEREYETSQSRRVLRVGEDGRPVLQHTRTTAADFERSERTPGTIVVTP